MAPLELERTPAHLTTHQTAGTGTQYHIRKKKKRPPPALKASQRLKKKKEKEKGKLESVSNGTKSRSLAAKSCRQIKNSRGAACKKKKKKNSFVESNIHCQGGRVFDSFHFPTHRVFDGCLLAARTNQGKEQCKLYRRQDKQTKQMPVYN